MATKLYLGSSGTPEVSPSYSADWDVTSDAVRRPFTTFPRSSTMTTKSFSDADETAQKILLFQFVGPPMLAGTSGTSSGSMVIRASETDAGNNMFTAVKIRFVKEDGTGYATPKVALALAVDGTEIVVSTLTARSLSFGAITDTTIAEGDRLVIEIGGSGDPDAGKNHSFSLSYGDDSATDLSLTDDTTTAANNPFTYFSTASFAFMGRKLYLPASTGTAATVSPAYSSAWTDTSQVHGRIALQKTPSGSVMANHNIADASETAQDILVMQYVSPPMHPFSGALLGTKLFDYVARASETDLSNNLDLRCLVRIVKEDGTDYVTPEYFIATLTAADTSEVTTTLQSASPAAAALGTSPTVQDGDRLVFEIGMGGDPAATFTHDGTISLGDDSGSDLANGSAETNAFNPWVQFGSGTSDFFPFKWTAGFITYYETPAMTVAISSSLSSFFQTFNTITATAAMSSSVGKSTLVTRTMTAVGANSLSKFAVNIRSFAASAAMNVSLTTLKTTAVALSYIMAGSAAMSKTYIWALTKQITSSMSSSVTKLVQVTRTISGGGSANLTYGEFYSLLLQSTAAVSSAVVSAGYYIQSINATMAGVSSISKTIQVTRTFIPTITSSMIKQISPVAKQLTMAAVATSVEAMYYIQAINATCGVSQALISASVTIVVGGQIASSWIISIVSKITSGFTDRFQ